MTNPLYPPYMPDSPDMAQEADGDLSDYGLDCCEEARRLSYHGLRYSQLLGECIDCGATDWTLMPAGWAGPVKHESAVAELPLTR